MVNPYEKWEDEGLHAEDRLLPSLLKETLCSEEWWKATYDGKDLYFNFEEEGMAVSSSSLYYNAFFIAGRSSLCEKS